MPTGVLTGEWILGVVSLAWTWLERIYQHMYRNDNQQLQGGGGYIQCTRASLSELRNQLREYRQNVMQQSDVMYG